MPKRVGPLVSTEVKATASSALRGRESSLAASCSAMWRTLPQSGATVEHFPDALVGNPPET
jgi:hypothetical protein